jgi:predicted dehydrogenase
VNGPALQFADVNGWDAETSSAGTHVLCEKPYSRSAAEVAEAFAAAEGAGVVLAEALMWRHHPQALRLAELVAGGAIGELRQVRSAFTFTLLDPANVRVSAELAGGAVGDLGCYCISAARLLAGEPVSATAHRLLAPSGVDRRVNATLEHRDDVLSLFHCGFDLTGNSELEAFGSEGRLRVSDPFHSVETGIELIDAAGRSERIEIPAANPYACELDDLAGAVAGEHPPRLGADDALGQARAIDAVLSAAETGRRVTL